jgi:hypothetical protein
MQVKTSLPLLVLGLAFCSPSVLANRNQINPSLTSLSADGQSYSFAPALSTTPSYRFRHVAQGLVNTSDDSSAAVATPKPATSAAAGKKRLKLNGFVSAGASALSGAGESKYVIPGHGAVGEKVGFAPNSLVGLQLTATINKKIAVIAQAVSSGDDTNGHKAYQMTTPWAFVRYKVNKGLQFELGRFRLPLFLYSDTQQVGYSYPWLYLPNEVYRVVPFENMNGINLVSKSNLGKSGWTLSIQPFAGADKSQYDIWNPSPTVPKATADFTENDILGAAVSVGNNNFTLRGAYAQLELTGGLPGKALPSSKPSFWSVGTKLTWKKLVFAAEYAQRENLPPELADLQGYYATLGFRIKKWLPSITYAHIDTTNIPTLEPIQTQTSYTLGVDYYANANWMAKLGVSYIEPNGVGLFNLKTKASYLYGISLNAIF